MGLFGRIGVALEASPLVNLASLDKPNLDLRTRPAAFLRPAGREADGPIGRDVCEVYILNSVSRDSLRFEKVEALQDSILAILRMVEDCYPDQSPVAPLDDYAIVEGARQTYAGFMVTCVGGP